MKRIFSTFLLLCLATMLQAATYYIDPTYSGSPRNGSSLTPWNSFSEIQWSSNNSYLQKRGTTLSGNYFRITATLTNVTIGAYGTGARPIINNTGTGKTWTFVGVINGLTIQDIEVTSTNYCTSLIQFENKSDNVVIRNCKLHKADFGLRVRSLVAAPNDFCTDVKLINDTIYDTRDDGVYMYKVHRPVMLRCHIHHANQFWVPPVTDQKVAAGDGFQFILTDRVIIMFCKIDRSDSGNKFCGIFSGTNDVPGNFIIITNNEFLMPIPTSQGGAGLYFGDLRTTTVVEFSLNDVIQPGVNGLNGIRFNSPGYLYTNGNLFQNCNYGIVLERPTVAIGESVSNTFTNCGINVTPTVIVR